ncbi:PIN domain-containing protein [Acidipropionibacterium timonense]|uniref:PIN domain-containing protein n=1 Tax=Acidipropionibacterium timonense TaxID=2161818 RepID=UPI0010306DD8|nr:PIN domain-containing protein [Acidipropionibacterium timonense]
MTRFSALLDTCVLVPIVQADTLLRLAEKGLYRPIWSARIMDELVSAIERVHPHLPPGAASRRSAQMNRAFPDACVRAARSPIEDLVLPDDGDINVLEAAIRGRADVIVTDNLKDFPESALAPFDLEAQSADEFLGNQLDLDPDATMIALAEQSAATRNPTMTVEAILTRIARATAPQFARAARSQLWRIASTPGNDAP